MRPTPARLPLWRVAIVLAVIGGDAAAQVAVPITLPEALRLAGVGSQFGVGSPSGVGLQPGVGPPSGVSSQPGVGAPSAVGSSSGVGSVSGVGSMSGVGPPSVVGSTSGVGSASGVGSMSGVGSQSVAAADAAVRAAEGRARQAALRPNPEARIAVENVAGSGPFSGFNATETTVAIGQRLEIGGKHKARTAVARADISVARLRLVLARADLIQDVKFRFADAVAADGRVRLAQDTLDLNRELLRVATALVDAGREPPLRALRAQTAAAEAQVAVNAAASERATALRALAALWGGEIAGVAGAPEVPTAGPIASDPTQTIDVLVATSEVASAVAVTRRERTLAVPDMIAEVGVRDFRETGDRALVFGLSVPLPFGNRNQGNIAAARADEFSAEARRNQAIIEARRRIGDARAGLAVAEAQLGLLRSSSLPAAQEAARLARLGYQAGKFALIDVLDAQTALAAARRALVDAELAHARSAAALERASATQEISR